MNIFDIKMENILAQKILKKYTIIPQELYVMRDADKQLKRIIDEMQRPGYVLVARQMGKTNLLFNAKRTLQNESNLFVYVDLSNSFDSASECFRYIIDMILEPNYDRFQNIHEGIESIRTNQKLASHVEYSNCLRLVLKEFGGKIVIILDEIDALASVDYTDQIFAQIRSTYFAGRTNFPEFNDLTYVLSGVVEPTELIKDKNKSPFNIGEKIYLNDFTFEEHTTFVECSHLDISEEVSKEIFDWTNGNPRMTFDICSEIEDIIIKDNFINIQNVQEVIQKLYLTNYDIAPIDHIKELVKTNGQIRKAVIKLHKKNFDISGDIRKKLYLYGIINGEFETKEIKIKNKIIENSLSLAWMELIETETANLFHLALDKIDVKEYKEAIKLFIEYLESKEEIPEYNRQLAYYKIGFCYHQLKNYESSNMYLLKEIIECDFSPDLHYSQKMYIGINYIYLDNKKEGVQILKDIIGNYKKGSVYTNACLNVAINEEKNYGYTQELLDNIIDKIDNNTEELADFSEDEFRSTKTIAYYYKARVYHEDSQIEKSILYYEKAKENAFENQKPLINLSLFTHTKYINLIKEGVDIIINENIKFDVQIEDVLRFNETHLYSYFYLLINDKMLADLDKLIDYAFHNLYTFDTLCKFYFHIITLYNYNQNQNQIILFFSNKIIEMAKDVEDDYILLTCYRTVFLLSKVENKNIENNFKKYQYYLNKVQHKLETDDVYAFIYAVEYYEKNNLFQNALTLLHTLEPMLSNTSEEIKNELVVVYHWFADIYEATNNHKKAVEYADKGLQSIQEIKKSDNKTSLLSEKGLEGINNHFLTIKKGKTMNIPILTQKEQHRNDKIKVKYLNGKVAEGKYKKFEDDIKNNLCIIIA